MSLTIKEAKDQLPELIARASREGPQPLEVEGQAPAAVISLEELKRLQQRKPTFVEFLISMPSLEGVDLTRDRSPARDIEL